MLSIRSYSALLAVAVLPAQTFNSNLITTFAGTDPSLQAPADALAVPLPPGPWGKPAIDAAGNIYFALSNQHIVLRLTPAGRLEKFAGTGFPRFSGDGGPAAQASLNFPRDIAIDSRGVIYIADAGNRRIRRILPSRVIDSLAGGGRVLPSVSGVPLADSALSVPASIAIDGSDNLYVSIDANSVARIDYNAPQIRLFAGVPGTSGVAENGPIAAARFRQISALAADKSGNLLLTDAGAISVVRLTPAGRVEILTTRSATFGPPADVAVDSTGAVFFTQSGSPVIWRVLAGNTVEIFAGDITREGLTPNGTPRDRALFGSELRLVFDARNNIILGDRRNGRIRRVGSTVDTIAGSDFLYSGEAGPAAAAVFFSPASMALNRAGTLFFTDSEARAVFSIDSRGAFRRFAGNGILNAAFTDGRAALEGAFGTPQGIAVDAAGTVFVADDDCAIRRIGSDGAMRLHAGVPSLCGNTADGVALRDFRFGRLRGLTIDSSGNMFVTDVTNHKVWRIGADSVVRTFAGTGAPGTSTTSLPAVQAALNNPSAVAVAADGVVYIADTGNQRVVRVGTDGRLVTIAGVGQRASTGDNGPSTSAAVNQPAGLALDASGNLYISEFGGHRIRRINSSGTIATFAGSGSPGPRGDGGLAVAAQLNSPAGLLLTPAGELLIADRENGRIRLVLNGAPAVRLPTAPVNVAIQANEFSQRGEILLPSPIAGLPYEASVRYAGAATGWLTVSPSRGTLPGRLGYEANSAGLQAGDYSAQIAVTVPSGTPRETLIPVNLRVPPPPARPFLTKGNARFTLSAVAGGAARQTIPITNPGAAPLTLRAAVTAGAFLAIFPPELTIAPGQAGVFTLVASAGSLAPGTYPGAAVITGANASSELGVLFNVSPVRSRLSLSQSGLFFRAVSGGAVPPPQLVYAASAASLNAQAQTVGNSPWLEAAVEENRLIVSVNPKELPAGDHYGRIAVADPSAPGPRQFVTVLLQVLPAGSDPGPELSPIALLFTAAPGAEVPGQEIELYLPTNRRGVFTATAASTDGQAWLQISPSAGQVAGGSPARISVQPDLTALAAGVYRGSITIQLDDGATRSVGVLAVVSPSASPTAKAPAREASGCSNADLFPQVLSPAPNFAITVGEPVRLAARVVDGCGNLHVPESGGNAAVAVTGFGTQVTNLTHTTGGVWEATATTGATQSAATLTFLAVFTRGASLQAGAAKVNGAVVIAQRPVVFNDSLTDAASFQFGAPIAPGTLVSLFGANLNPSNATPSALPLPTSLDATEVRLNDVPIPLLFAGPSQVNAQIPYSLSPDAEYQLEIRRGAAITTPQPIVISQARPGVFTVDQSGQGQGHIYRALADGSQRLADAANPAAAGEVIVIYCNGLGLTNPAVSAGAAAPSSPLAVTANPVTVTIGSRPAAVAFAGLAPGFTGLYQINAVVPAGVAAGDAVPLVLSVAGQSSVPVSLGIR